MAKREPIAAAAGSAVGWAVLVLAVAQVRCGGAAPSNSLQGTFSFDAVWAAFENTPQGPTDPPQQGAFVPATLRIMQADTDFSSTCSVDGGLSQATFRAMRLVVLAPYAPEIASGSFTIFASHAQIPNPTPAGIAALDIGTYSPGGNWVEEAAAVSGSVHLSEVGTARATGDFDVTMLLPDG